jgi:hypothetical protein
MKISEKEKGRHPDWMAAFGVSVDLTKPSSALDKDENRNHRNDDDGGRNPRGRRGEGCEWNWVRHEDACV